MSALQFWFEMGKAVLLPAVITCAVLVAPATAMPLPIAAGYLVFVATVLARLTWLVGQNRPPRILRRFGW